jgi:hypothetical protein
MYGLKLAFSAVVIGNQLELIGQDREVSKAPAL